MSEDKDYRVSYLLQNFKDEKFSIDRIEDGNMILVSESGKELDIKCALPRKITNVEDGTIVEVTKKRFSMKDLSKPRMLAENGEAGAASAISPTSTPSGEGSSNVR